MSSVSTLSFPHSILMTGITLLLIRNAAPLIVYALTMKYLTCCAHSMSTNLMVQMKFQLSCSSRVQPAFICPFKCYSIFQSIQAKSQQHGKCPSPLVVATRPISLLSILSKELERHYLTTYTETSCIL